MISKIRVENFKSLKELELDLKEITVFAGANGVGKSSIIQTLLLAKTSSEQISNFSNDIEINGPYNLQLGRTEQIMNFSAEEHKIKLFIGSNDQEIKIVFDVDIFHKPYVLSVDINESSSMNNLDSLNLYYLGAERVGPSKGQFFDPQQKLKVGYKGEYTNHVLSRADDLKIQIDDNMNNPDGLDRFSTQVEAWMKLIFPNFRLQYKEVREVDMVSVLYGNENLPQFIPQTSTGFGITYALPIITAGLLAVSSKKEDNILIVENPEAHLHPFGQSRLGQFLALLATNGVQVVIETHSEHIINGIRLELSKSNNVDKGIINFFTQLDEHTINQAITIRENGELSSWPNGFFDQEKLDLFELLKIKRGKKY